MIAILPETSRQGGRIVAERFWLSVKEASQGWIFPTFLTIGVVTYPEDGSSLNSMVDAAETAKKKGKDGGKDRVVLSE